ncbi:hypothetical protein [Nonomuraea sp. MG754425]|nr:hypothetical protein [Nonomuraea sp. MG754425]
MPTSTAWWDWPLQFITEHVRTIMSGSVGALEQVAAAQDLRPVH